MRWPPTGFGEQWNVIIYFKETRDILGLNWRIRNYRKLWQSNLGNMGEKVSFSKGRWNMPPPNFQRKFYDPEPYSVVMVSNDGTVKLPNEARKWPAVFNLFWLTATVLSKQEVFLFCLFNLGVSTQICTDSGVNSQRIISTKIEVWTLWEY